MALTIDEVKKIAALARLELTPEEEPVYAEQLARIVGYMDQLQGFEGAEPPVAAGLDRRDRDEARDGLARDVFLANAPQRLDGYLVVPRVKTTPADRGKSEDG